MADFKDSSPLGKGESVEGKLSAYKQKLKILKKAYLSEQEEKENFRKQLISSYNTIDKLQKDLEEKEQRYLKTYKENQELHSNLIEERSSSSRGHRGSVMLNSYDSALFTGYSGKSAEDGSSKQKLRANGEDENVLSLKVKQQENQIKHIEEEKNKLEQELYSKMAEIAEIKESMQSMLSEQTVKVRELQYSVELLQNERDEVKVEFDRRVEELEKQKNQAIELEKAKCQEEADLAIKKEKEIQNELKEQIQHLREESNNRTDEFLKQGVYIDELKEEITILKENEVKLK